MGTPGSWYLEGFVGVDRLIWKTFVEHSSFRIGRAESCDLVLPFPQVSQHHALLFRHGGRLLLRDLGSKNGTFVNDRRIETETVVEGEDILRFADREFRLVGISSAGPALTTASLLLDETWEVSSSVLTFDEAVTDLFTVLQPVVRLSDRTVIGYEVLGRARARGEVVSPLELFALAEGEGREVELSGRFRRLGLAQMADQPAFLTVFLNLHPAEIEPEAGRLLESFRELRAAYPARPMVLELHEAAVPDLGSLSGLRDGLAELGMAIAFDDFGTGRDRLLELSEVGPSFVKFDRAWIQGLHRAEPRRVEMVRTLVRMVSDLGITTVAEGVERPEEAAKVSELGFDLVQGFLFGRPQAL